MTDDSPVLLPCPFCGETPNVMEDGKTVRHRIASGCFVGWASVEIWNRRASGKTECRVVGGKDVAEQLRVAQQAFLEFGAAYERGPDWYTRGESGLRQQVRMWIQRGSDALANALALLERAAPPLEQQSVVGEAVAAPLAAERPDELAMLKRLVEETIMVAKTDEDGDGFTSAYHFQTGAIHRLLAAVRTGNYPAHIYEYQRRTIHAVGGLAPKDVGKPVVSGVHAERPERGPDFAAMQRAVRGPYKVGSELLMFHPDASHVPPDYRDGWNACYRAIEDAAIANGKDHLAAAPAASPPAPPMPDLDVGRAQQPARPFSRASLSGDGGSDAAAVTQREALLREKFARMQAKVGDNTRTYQSLLTEAMALFYDYIHRREAFAEREGKR